MTNKNCRLLAYYTLLILTVICPLRAIAADTDKPAIVVLGDSLSAAYEIPVASGWVALLARQIDQKAYPYRVVNEAISGDTTGNGLARLTRILKKYKTKILIVELGANDGLRGYPLTQMKSNLMRMIDMGRAHGAKILLLGVDIPANYGARYTEKFSAVYSELAKEKKVAFIPKMLGKIPIEEEYFLSDRLHPAVIAQPLILETVWAELVSLL